jgi:hypothetical protein
LRTTRRVPVLPVLRALAAVGVVSGFALAAGGCPRRTDPVPPDAGLGEDARPIGLDTDLDGLCDANELTRGLRIDDPDTDGDGYSDFVEVSLGLDPFSRESPASDAVSFLRESATGMARVTVSVPVNGSGESYGGAFAEAFALYPEGVGAQDFFAGSGPVGAEPMGNVAFVDTDSQSFVGVLGSTLLTFEVSFRFQGAALGCMRAYPFQFTVKREDGLIVASRRFVLVVLPPGALPGESAWCGAEPCY